MKCRCNEKSVRDIPLTNTQRPKIEYPIEDKIKVVGVANCPVCNYGMDFVLSKDATLNSLEDMNWKKKVKDAINKKITEHDDGDCNYDALVELLKELGL